MFLQAADTLCACFCMYEALSQCKSRKVTGKFIIQFSSSPYNSRFLFSAMEAQPVQCAICKASIGTGVPSSALTAKGSSTINQASDARKDSIRTMPGEIVHQECHRIYCHPFQIAKDTNLEELMPSTSEGRPVLSKAIQDMLPYMAASGHNSYTKSAMLYLLQMSNLKTRHPDVQQHFNEGLHVI